MNAKEVLWVGVLIVVWTILFITAPDDIPNYVEGDIITLEHDPFSASHPKTEREDYMVGTVHSLHDMELSGPGPESNEKHRTRRVNQIHLKPVSVIRKSDPGWQEHAAWFLLQ